MTMVLFGFGAALPRAAASRRIVDLGTLPGHTSSVAHAINNDGQIVGESNHAISREIGESVPVEGVEPPRA
jgi:uncharacterized membrane protein